jgi:hypothetical protein
MNNCGAFDRPTACSYADEEPSTNPYFVRRHFLIYADEEPWATDEIVSPSTWAKPQIWEHLRFLEPLPDISQFQVIQDELDISALDNLPPGNFTIRLQVFAVQWEIEMPSGIFGSLTLQGMAARHSVQDAWQLLHHDNPRLFENAVFNCIG